MRTVHVRGDCLMRAPGLITRFCASLEVFFRRNDRFQGVFSVYLQSPLLIPPRSNTLRDKLTFNKLAMREERDRTRKREGKRKWRERERERKRERWVGGGNQAWGLLVPPVHILPLIPAPLYPLHLKQGCLLWAKTWILLDHADERAQTLTLKHSPTAGSSCTRVCSPCGRRSLHQLSRTKAR